MTTMQEALFAFWSQFSYDGKPIPAYCAGMVPDGAAFPYITFTASRGEAFSRGINTAFVWVRRENGVSPLPACAAILDSIAKALPAEGKIIRADGSCAVLYRNGSEWQTCMQDAEDPAVLGGRTSYQINYYT